jgi:hypothetical protein
MISSGTATAPLPSRHKQQSFAACRQILGYWEQSEFILTGNPSIDIAITQMLPGTKGTFVQEVIDSAVLLDLIF